MSSHKALDAVITAFAGAYETVENSGSNIEQVCSLARRRYHGKPVPRDDIEYIVNGIAKVREWEGDTAQVRRSEVRRVLVVYAALPSAIAKVREKEGACNWRTALKVATVLRKHGGKVGPALAEYAKRETRRLSPQSRTIGVLRSWYQKARGEQREAIMKAAELLGLHLGVEPQPARHHAPRTARVGGETVVTQ